MPVNTKYRPAIVPIPKPASPVLGRRAMLARTAQTVAIAAAGPLLAGQDTHNDQRTIWDAHVHLGGTGTVRQRVDRLLACADRLEIGRLVVFMGTRFIADPSPEELRHQNDEVLEAIDYRPNRLLGMVYVNPKHIKASLAEMDRCVGRGPMVGVKLWIALRCNRPELDPIVRRAVELKVPLLQHAFDRVDENLPGESGCADVAELGSRHPDATLICSHVGNDWERGIRMIRATANVYAEVCGSDPTAGFVEMAARELGAGRVLYGSDAPGRSFASQLAKVTGAALSDADRQGILGGNLRRILAPALAAKGSHP